MSALPDGGGEALSGIGSGGTPADGSVTLAKMANLATDRVIGRVSSGTGVPEAVTFTDAAQALCDDTTVAAMRATLGLEIHAEYIALAACRSSVTADVYATGTATLVIGGSPVAIDPATYARTGLTAAFHLVGTGFTDNASRTGTLTLWDLTTDAAVATATFNNATTPAAFTPAVATLNATPHVYEVRFSVSGTLVTHAAYANNVSLRITWS